MRHGIIVASLMLPLHPCAAAAQDKPVEGPKKVCFMYSSFDLPAGQSLVHFRGSVESMQVGVRGPAAGYTIIESQIINTPSPDHGLVASYGETEIYQRRDRGKVSYDIYGPADFFGGAKVRLRILSGVAFTGGKRDIDIYSRFRIVDPEQIKCDHRFLYGREFMVPNASN